MRALSPELAEDGLENRQQRACAFGADHEIPERLESLPACRIGEVARASHEIAVSRSALEDRAPAVELTVCPVVPAFKLGGRHVRGPEHGVACVVQIPVLNRDAALVRDAIVECRGWV